MKGEKQKLTRQGYKKKRARRGLSLREKEKENEKKKTAPGVEINRLSLQ